MLSISSPPVLDAPSFFEALAGDLAFCAAVVGREGPAVVVAFLVPRGALGAGSLRGAVEVLAFLTRGLALATDFVVMGELGTVRACSTTSGRSASPGDTSLVRDAGISLRRRLVLLTAGSPLFVLEGTPRAAAFGEVSLASSHDSL